MTPAMALEPGIVACSGGFESLTGTLPLLLLHRHRRRRRHASHEGTEAAAESYRRCAAASRKWSATVHTIRLRPAGYRYYR
jgi:hypothetical protein